MRPAVQRRVGGGVVGLACGAQQGGHRGEQRQRRDGLALQGFREGAQGAQLGSKHGPALE